MKLKKTKEETNKASIDKKISNPSSLLIKENHIMRRKQEIKRRIGVLQSRKIYLEKELNTVKLCMVSLNKQLQNYS